jgi:hypothetical protein
MRTWVSELQAHTHDYVRRGGKGEPQETSIVNYGFS